MGGTASESEQQPLYGTGTQTTAAETSLQNYRRKAKQQLTEISQLVIATAAESCRYFEGNASRRQAFEVERLGPDRIYYGQ